MNETPIFIGLLHKLLQQAIHCTAGSDPCTKHPRGANFSARGTKEGRSKAEAMQNSRRINGVTLHCKGSPVQAVDTGRSRYVTALFHLPKSPHERQLGLSYEDGGGVVGRRHRPSLVPASQTDKKDITVLSLTRKDKTHLSFSVVGSPLRFEEFL